MQFMKHVLLNGRHPAQHTHPTHRPHVNIYELHGVLASSSCSSDWKTLFLQADVTLFEADEVAIARGEVALIAGRASTDNATVQSNLPRLRALMQRSHRCAALLASPDQASMLIFHLGFRVEGLSY